MTTAFESAAPRCPERASTKTAGRETEHRPWGWFTILYEGVGFKLKHIVVEPGGRLSLQTHARRAEHWVVVGGRAEVHVDGRTFNLERGASVDIPVGAVHRLSNPGDERLEVIETQFGDYLGEDDIMRLEDIYDRI